jgi:hypothetical protein
MNDARGSSALADDVATELPRIPRQRRHVDAFTAYADVHGMAVANTRANNARDEASGDE